MSITREQLNEALSTVREGESDEVLRSDSDRYLAAVRLLADVVRGEGVIDLCTGSGQLPGGGECRECFYEHGFVVPDHYYVPASELKS